MEEGSKPLHENQEKIVNALEDKIQVLFRTATMKANLKKRQP